MRFQPASAAALPTPVPVTLKHRAPCQRPAPGIQPIMVTAHPASPASRQDRRCTLSKNGSDNPPAMTAALSKSIRPLDLDLSSPGFPLGSRRIVLLAMAVDNARDALSFSLRVSTRRWNDLTSAPPSLPAPTRLKLHSASANLPGPGSLEFPYPCNRQPQSGTPGNQHRSVATSAINSPTGVTLPG